MRPLRVYPPYHMLGSGTQYGRAHLDSHVSDLTPNRRIDPNSTRTMCARTLCAHIVRHIVTEQVTSVKELAMLDAARNLDRILFRYPSNCILINTEG